MVYFFSQFGFFQKNIVINVTVNIQIDTIDGTYLTEIGCNWLKVFILLGNRLMFRNVSSVFFQNFNIKIT